MNRRTCICLLAATTLAACGQPPSPGMPRAVPRAEVTTTSATTSTTTTTTTTVPPPPTTTPPKPRPTTTKATVKSTPTPSRPKRLVLPTGLRGSIESRIVLSPSTVWAQVQNDLQSACPGTKPCVGYELVVDPSSKLEGDCRIVDKGISVPDPLYEGGKIMFRVNNKNNCFEG